MGIGGIWQWVVVLAIALVLFGGRGKISSLMGDFGKGLKSFKKGIKEDEPQSVEDEGREWIDALVDDSAQAAERVEESHDTLTLRSWLLSAMQALNEREQFIVRERKLRDQPRTLESLGAELSLSKERVRQLEAAAFGKMRKTLETQSSEVRHFLM